MVPCFCRIDFAVILSYLELPWLILVLKKYRHEFAEVFHHRYYFYQTYKVQKSHECETV